VPAKERAMDLKKLTFVLKKEKDHPNAGKGSA